MTEEELDAIRFENEFLKAKIMAEFGAKSMYINPDWEISPELLNDFLKSIISVEQSMEDVGQVPIYDYLGRPPFVREQDLDDEQLPAELERVMGLLDEKKILCDAFYPVDDRVFYKFITEELFLHLILDIHDSDFGTHYFYESFHPNHACDTKELCEDFLGVFFCDDFDQLIRNFSPEEIRNFVELSDFRDCFTGFGDVDFEVLEGDASPDECSRTAILQFDAFTDKGSEPIHYEGRAGFQLNYNDGQWVIVSVVLPGMAPY